MIVYVALLQLIEDFSSVFSESWWHMAVYGGLPLSR